MKTPPIITVLPAFADNYIFLTAANGKIIIVDPGIAAPVLDSIPPDADLQAILITHRHADHIGGVAEILRRFPATKIYAPHGCNFPNAAETKYIGEGDCISLLNGALNLQTIATPGHTLEHIALHDSENEILFCGDTLFACGCGRMLEGTAAQMQKSLSRLAALPACTTVYCGHEYTAANIRFALAVEPENAALRQREKQTKILRAKNEATIPFTIGDELATNPFVRLQNPAVIAAARKHGAENEDAISIFAALRRWKDNF